MKPLTDSERKIIEILTDPVKWAENTLRLRDGPLKLRWYQSEIMKHAISDDPNSKRIVLRWGRRTGKTSAVAAFMLWYCFVNKNGKVLMSAPYDNQVALFFKMVREFIAESPELQNSVLRDTKNPHYIEFKNGSTLSGFTSGTKSGAKGDSIRGQAADWIFLDEADRFSEDDYDSITAVTLEDTGRIGIIAASTPTGRRSRFYEWCHSDMWQEFHRPSSVMPTWNKESEISARNMLSEQGYIHEVCLVPGTLVRTLDGMKRIELITTEDQVLTHRGEFKPVTRIYKRDVYEDLLSINAYYERDVATMTRNHPVLAWKPVYCVEDKGQVCSLGCETQCSCIEPSWVPASELTEDAYLAFPIPNTGTQDIDSIQMSDVVDLPYVASERYIYIQEGKHKRKRPNTIPVNEHLMNLVGAYLAKSKIIDGSLALTVKARSVQPVIAAFKELFGISVKAANTKGGSDSYVIFMKDTLIVNFLRNLLKIGCIPPWMLQLPNTKLLYLLRSYLTNNAGAYEEPRRDTMISLTTNMQMAYDVHLLLLRFGIVASLGIQKRGEEVRFHTLIIRNEMFNRVMTDILNIDHESGYGALCHVGSDYVYIPIKAITRKRYKGPVYNLEVEDHQSYCLGFKCVHNCAEFGEETIGVFHKRFIDRAKQHDDYYYLDKATYPAYRIIGVDFDKYGDASQIIVLEYDQNFTVDNVKSPKFRIIHRAEIPKGEFTLDNTVRKIIELNTKFNPRFIYCDRGYGEYQVETLHKYGMQHPETELHHKVKGVAFSSSLDVRDPFTKQVEKKPIKPFMVNQLSIWLERDNLILSPHDELIWKQMENYQVIRKTVTGQPVYTSENEHALDALMLAVLGFTLEFPQLANIVHKIENARHVAPLPRINPYKDKVLSGTSARDINPQEGLWDPDDPEEKRGHLVKHKPKTPVSSTPAHRVATWGSRGSTTKEPKRRTW